MIVGNKFYHLTEIDSTNEYVKQMMRDVPEGTVVLADIQTRGKGRTGRDWHSPEGGLWMSVLLYHHQSYLVSLLAGVTICETLELYEITPGIKWPNDILLNGKKIAGILCEVIDEKVVLGIGLNLNIRHFPDDLLSKATSVFMETRKHLDLHTVYHQLRAFLDANYKLLQDKEIDALLTKWRKYSIMLDRDVTIELPDRVIVGKVLDVDHQGGLVLMRADHGIEHVIAGNCRLLS
ncbi:biotin--[acetyl-CoA-carboxylase] ligase [candidate division WOR-3 bacterium]|nr:biotin--[acetyl-CoA-carboxylase] ligase [candidate division WOR-3 bacterium]